MSEERITRRSSANFRQDKTDWEAVAKKTDEEIERDVASDPDAAPLLDEEWFKGAEVVYPKEAINIRLDKDILDFFRGEGPRYQTRINSILRAYVTARRKTG